MKEQPLIGILIVILIVLIKQKLPWQLKFIWGYFLTVTAFHTFWPYFEPKYAPQLSNIIAWSSTTAFCVMLMYPFVMLNASEKIKCRFITATKWYMAYDCLNLLWGGHGVFSATTFDATLIACFILQWDLKKKIEWIGFVLSLVAIAYVKSRTGMLVVGAIYGVTIMQWGRHRFAHWYSLLAGIIAALTVCAVMYYDKMITDPRFEMWDSFFKWWVQKVNVYFGTGIGAFEWTGPYIDPGATYRNQGIGFYVMHNDWLQLLFEAGFIGLALGLAGFAYVGWRLKGRDLATWLGIGVGMMFYYISHAWPVQFLALILISNIDSNPPLTQHKPTRRNHEDYIAHVHFHS